MSSLEKFTRMLAQAPFLEPYWTLDRNTPEIQLPELKTRMATMSHGECVLAEFFIGVWTGDGEKFDLIEAGSTLDLEYRRIVSDWVLDPFWP